MAKKLTTPEQIRRALDGRSQRWLAMEIKMPETNLSKKMNGVAGWPFTEADLKKINARLGAAIKV